MVYALLANNYIYTSTRVHTHTNTNLRANQQHRAVLGAWAEGQVVDVQSV